MHLLLACFVCVGLFMLFPKGFKYMVGTFVGLITGGLAWGVCAVGFPTLVSYPTFLGFLVGGIVSGCVIAAKG